jgi:hypothetical protein
MMTSYVLRMIMITIMMMNSREFSLVSGGGVVDGMKL